jgi:hypothetical protein
MSKAIFFSMSRPFTKQDRIKSAQSLLIYLNNYNQLELDLFFNLVINFCLMSASVAEFNALYLSIFLAYFTGSEVFGKFLCDPGLC